MPKIAPLNDGFMAAVDLGSNSFHLAVAKLEHGVIRLNDSQSEKVQLAAGLDHNNNLTLEAQERGLACLARFAQKLDGVEPARVRVVATNALRVARNAREFTQKAERILNRPIEIIAGREEARLIYIGVSHSLAAEGKRLVVDIGGGSTECIIGEQHDPLLTESLHMGCVSFTKRFFPDGQISEKALQRAFTAARLEIAPIARRYRELGWDSATGSSGTIKAIANTLQTLGWASPEGHITNDGLEQLRAYLLQFSSTKDIQISGLKDDRRQLIPAGFAIVSALFAAFKLQQMNYSDGALREGVLYDLLGRSRSEGDVRQRTVTALQKRLGLDEAFAKRTADTASNLFEQVQQDLQLSDDDAGLLERAAQLHEIGLAISHSGYHRHGAYLLMHSDLLGFAKPEQECLALLVGGHRRRLRAEQRDNLLAAGGERLLHLCLLLRLAVLLNHSRSREELPNIRLSASADVFQLKFPRKWLDTHPLTLADLEQEQEYFLGLGLTLNYA